MWECFWRYFILWSCLSETLGFGWNISQFPVWFPFLDQYGTSSFWLVSRWNTKVFTGSISLIWQYTTEHGLKTVHTSLKIPGKNKGLLSLSWEKVYVLPSLSPPRFPSRTQHKKSKKKKRKKEKEGPLLSFCLFPSVRKNTLSSALDKSSKHSLGHTYGRPKGKISHLKLKNHRIESIHINSSIFEGAVDKLPAHKFMLMNLILSIYSSCFYRLTAYWGSFLKWVFTWWL